jgi:hypothetical protein
MARKMTAVCLAGFIMMAAAGCAPLVVGMAVGGVAMYAVSKDTIQGETDKPYEALWQAAREVGRMRATIKSENLESGTVYLESDSGRAWVRLVRVNDQTTRLKVSARKYHMPNISYAQELFSKIIEQVDKVSGTERL